MQDYFKFNFVEYETKQSSNFCTYTYEDIPNLHIKVWKFIYKYVSRSAYNILHSSASKVQIHGQL